VRRICSPGYDGRRACGASGRARALGWLLGPLLLVLPALASGQIDTADPLEVPTGAEPVLADRLDSPERRIEAAIAGFRERGYQELPVLAAAALQSQGSAAEERALEAAPSIPAVRYEVGRRSSNPVEVARAIGSTLGNLPSLVWLASWVGAALGLGLLACTAGLVALGLARSIGLHGHWVGHLAWDRDPPAWPGGLILASLLVLLPLLGVGPMLLVALAGALAAFRLTRREGLWIGSALLVSGLLLGPALPLWARLATLRAHDPAVLAAWRIERQQPLPGDLARLERALETHPQHGPARLATAVASLRAGEIDRVEPILAELPEGLRPELAAHAGNLHGTVLLARGEVRDATLAFEAAAAAHETAGVLYNLSQAHGRGLRLSDQGRVFGAARELDPDLVTRYTGNESANVHHALIETPLPMRDYLTWALAPSPESAVLTRDLRERALGRVVPDRAWIGVALLGVVALFLRNGHIRRCTRCFRALCDRCSTVPSKKERQCARCASLFSQSASTDARLRREQLDRDRRRTRSTARGLAALGLLLPGAGRIFEGRTAGGAIALLLAASGGAALLTHGQHAVPPEVGGLAEILPVGFALLALVPAYGIAAGESVGRLRALGRSG
jgi:hypothetical protein